MTDEPVHTDDDVTAGAEGAARARDVSATADDARPPARAPDVPPTADDALAAIAATTKQARKPTPRWVWILAGIVGIACTIGFVVLMLAPSDTSGPVADVSATTSRLGFGAGLVIGLVAGIGIGIAIARRRT